MARRVSNSDLLKTVYASAQQAADELDGLPDGEPSLAQVTAIRKLLREAYCAIHELKQRIKNK